MPLSLSLTIKIIYYIAEGTTQDSQEDIIENCSNSEEETEDKTNEMVSNTECTVDCCLLVHDKPTVLAKTKRFHGSRKSRQAKCV